MASFNIPYIISFIIRKEGTLLDGMPLDKAITLIDSQTNPKPAAYLVNCVHPTVLHNALKSESLNLQLIKERLPGIQANTSRKTPEELDGLNTLDSEDAEVFAEEMMKLHTGYGLKILGGCCGTDDSHICAIAEEYQHLDQTRHFDCRLPIWIPEF